MVDCNLTYFVKTEDEIKPVTVRKVNKFDLLQDYEIKMKIINYILRIAKIRPPQNFPHIWDWIQSVNKNPNPN
jgi:hypothetical protein